MSVSRRMIQVDAHAHLGPDRLFGLPAVTGDELLAGMDRYGVHTSLVMPQPGIECPLREHDAIAELAQRVPGRVFGLALPDLRGSEGAYRREAERCVRELGFVGLKLHTAGHAVSPASPLGRLPFEVAAELGTTLVVHTGFQVPYALPSLVGIRAREFPGLRIVLAHAGMAPYFAEAIDVAQQNPHVYLEASWLPVYALKRAIDQLGPGRVLFGSDIIPNIPVARATFEAADLDDAALTLCYGGAARAAFSLPGGGS